MCQLYYMGYNTYWWGPKLWEFLHCLTFDYPLQPTEEDKQHYREFFQSLQYVLPCIYCRRNYVRNMNEIPIRLDNRNELVFWLIDLHNEVNGKEGKRSHSYDEVIKMYETRLGKSIDLNKDVKNKTCDYHMINNPLTTMEMILLIIIVLLLFYIVFFH